MAQWTKVLALKDDNSSLSPRIHTGTRKNQLMGGEWGGPVPCQCQGFETDE